MKRTKLIILSASLIIASIIVVAVKANNEDNSRNSAPTSSAINASEAKISEETNLSSSSTATPTTKGAYIDYKPDIIANTTGTKLIFFYAPWCPQCRELEADIKAKGVPDGVSIIKTDYDSNQNLRKKYGVTIQTTLVRVDDSGGFIKKYVAYEEPNLESVKENLL